MAHIEQAAFDVEVPDLPKQKICLACNREYNLSYDVGHCPNDGTALIVVTTGDAPLHGVLLNSYRFVQKVSSGGFSTVYKARNVFTGDDVAVKIAEPRFHSRYESFDIGAEYLQKLDHPNIVRFVEKMMVAKEPAYVTEYVNGVSLQRYLRHHQTLSLPQFAYFFHQVCAALAHAHEQDIYHWDLGPNDILISEQGKVTLIDFGKGRPLLHSENQSAQATAMGDLFGNPMYMAPESGLHNIMDARANVYTVGCLMYQALEGAPPFYSESWCGALLDKIAKEPPAMTHKLTKVPELVERMIMRAISKDSIDRQQSMLELCDELVYCTAAELNKR